MSAKVMIMMGGEALPVLGFPKCVEGVAGADPASTYTIASDSLYCAAPRNILRRVPDTQAYAHHQSLGNTAPTNPKTLDRASGTYRAEGNDELRPV